MGIALTFVTSNPDKLSEIRSILRPFGIRVRWGRRELPEPQADTLEEVVRAKLRAVPRRARAVLVEDSGIFLSGLHGFPGVYSRYALGTIGLEGILRLVEGRERRAIFRTVAGVRRGRRIVLTEGVTRGRIAPRARGSNGFGYDPIFIPDGRTATFGEMSLSDKNALSHRGRAIRAMARRLTVGEP